MEIRENRENFYPRNQEPINQGACNIVLGGTGAFRNIPELTCNPRVANLSKYGQELVYSLKAA